MVDGGTWRGPLPTRTVAFGVMLIWAAMAMAMVMHVACCMLLLLVMGIMDIMDIAHCTLHTAHWHVVYAPYTVGGMPYTYHCH